MDGNTFRRFYFSSERYIRDERNAAPFEKFHSAVKTKLTGGRLRSHESHATKLTGGRLRSHESHALLIITEIYIWIFLAEQDLVLFHVLSN